MSMAMLKSLNQFIKLLFIFILVARISVSQPREPKQATKCTTKCVNDMEKLAQLKQACETMTMSKCGSHFGARTERNAKSSRKCFRVNTHQSSTKSECVQLLQDNSSQMKSCHTLVYFCLYPDGVKFLEQDIEKASAHSIRKRDTAKTMNVTIAARTRPHTTTVPNVTSSTKPKYASGTQSQSPTKTISTTTNVPIISTTTTQPTSKQNTSQTYSSISTASMIPKTFFLEHWKNVCYIAGGLVLILVAVVLFKYCKRKNSDSRKQIHTVEMRPVSLTSTLDQNEVRNSLVYANTVEVRPVSPTSTLGQNEVQNSPVYVNTVEQRSISPTSTLGQNEVSPVYCEADTFQFPSSESRSETAETVETEVNEPTDAESNSEDEYSYPEIIDDVYETMNPVNSRRGSGEYAYAYEHLNTFPRKRPTNEIEDEYEYPQNRRKTSEWSDNEYRYAYDWRDPGFKEATLSSSAEPVLAYTPVDTDKVDGNFYENFQTLSRESLEKENETIPLVYVTVL